MDDDVMGAVKHLLSSSHISDSLMLVRVELFSAFSCTVVIYVVLTSEVRTSAPGS
jgi:hypothetical protein